MRPPKRPRGEFRLAALTPPLFLVLEVKLLPWPTTTLAGPPTHGKVLLQAINGVVYSSSRLFSVSAA
jgi:hypothetical protein